jgi:hypothetical protein
VRADAYFKDVLGVQLGKTAENDRRNFILLALELLKAMARLYPVEYDDEQTDSIFKEYYDKLKAKGVIFPEDNSFILVKKTDEESFKKNYTRFLSYQQELDKK